MDDCATDIGRDLIRQEHYALAKMTLFSVLDEAEGSDYFTWPIAPTATEMQAHLQTLGRA